MASYEAVLTSPLSPSAAHGRVERVTGCSSWTPGRTDDGGASIEVRNSSSSLLMRTSDKISFVVADEGSLITYESEARLRGPMRLLDPLLRLAFSRLGKRVAKGLVGVLGGQVLGGQVLGGQAPGA